MVKTIVPTLWQRVILKNYGLVENKKIAKVIGVDERTLTKRLIKLVSEDAKIGFEMTNHYYYDQNTLFEKLLNLEYILEKI